jgi:hypothetical protein
MAILRMESTPVWHKCNRTPEKGMVRRDCTADLPSQSHVEQCGNAIAAPTDQTQRLSYDSHNNGLRVNISGSTLTIFIPQTDKYVESGTTTNYSWSQRKGSGLSFLTAEVRTIQHGNSVHSRQIRSVAAQYWTRKMVVNGAAAAAELGNYDLIILGTSASRI